MCRWHLKQKLNAISKDREEYYIQHLENLIDGSKRARDLAGKMIDCRPGRPCRKPPCILCWDRAANEAKAENEKLFAEIPKENTFHITVLFEPRIDLFKPRDTADEFKKFKKAIGRKVPRSSIRIVRLTGRFEIEVKGWNETEYLRATYTLLPDEVGSHTDLDENFEINLQADDRKVLIPHFHGLIAISKNGEWYSSQRIRSIFMSPDDHCDKVRVSKLRRDQDKGEAVSKVSGYMHKGFTAGFEGDLLEQYVTFYTDVRPDRLRFRIKRDPRALNRNRDDISLPETPTCGRERSVA